MEERMKQSRSLSITLIIATLILGCAAPEVNPTAPTINSVEEATEAPAEIPDAGPSPQEPITILDALGNETTFAEPPQRIAIAGKATALIAHSVYMFPEAVEHIVAVEDRVQRDLSFYRVIDPKFDEKLQLERNAGPEQIIPSNPDVVFMKSYLAESLGDPIEQLGIPVVYFDLESPEQFERDIAVIGKLLGNEQRAEQIINFYKDRSNRINSLIADTPEEEYPSVLLMQYSDRGGEIAFNVPSTEWLQTSLIEQAGGDPVWLQAAQGGGWTIVGFEQIAAWDPQIVIVIYYPDNPAPIVETLLANENWQALTASQNDQIYGFPGDFLSWDQPDPRWILGLTWLATILHPETTDSIDLKSEIYTFYREMYELDQATIDERVFTRLSPEIE
jgi:iron complex transport system substrate-binding protein